MTTYFRTAADCVLVEGRGDAVVYDVSGGTVFSLDAASHRLLRRCEDNEPVDAPEGSWERGLLDTLVEKGLGDYQEAPVYIDRHLPNSPIALQSISFRPPQFRDIVLGITNECDLDCSFCGRADETLSWQACNSCVRRDRGESSDLLASVPEEAIAGAYQLGIRSVHLRGGNPLIERDRLERVVAKVESYGDLALMITTPGTGMPVADVLALYGRVKLLVNVVLQVSTEEDACDLFGRVGVFAHQAELIDSLVREKKPLALTLLLSEATRPRRDEILAVIYERWTGNVAIAEVYSKDAVRAGLRFGHVPEKGKNLSPWRSTQHFFHRLRTNTCLYGQFEVGYDGKMRPCAGIDEVCGDVAADGFHAAMGEDRLYELWHMDKGKVEPCDQCALRAACADCTAVELAGQADPTLKQSYCAFDPSGDERVCATEFAPAGFVERIEVPEEART